MKILHTSDWHLGAYVGPQCDDPIQRMTNTVKCLESVVDAARDEQPDLILITGDIFHAAKVWADRALTEVRVAAKYINLLSQFAPIAVLYGTPNHDGIGQYETLKEMTPGITYFTEPGIKTITTMYGPIQVAGLPGFDKGHFRSEFPGLSAEEENQVLTSALVSIINGLSAQLDSKTPSVLMAHHTVVGCDLDNGQSSLFMQFMQNEMVIPITALTDSGFDLICLGHIHKPQAVENPSNKPIFYAGSLDAFNFNDEGHEKGFWLHSLFNPGGRKHKAIFCRTPAREFKTITMTQDEVNGFLNNEYGFYPFPGSVVRVLYSCDSETEKALNKRSIEQILYNAGAYYVSEIRPESIHEVVNREKLTEKLTVHDCLVRYLQEKGKSEAEISQLLQEAADIIVKVQASQPMGTTSGIFLPVAIEVKNYRSYVEEKFSFEDIFFAMVNGKNGSGKSSLFMDSILDCLYEQPRDGELTGWIRAGAASGSISFTFKLGDDLWRVTRTRQRSGKGTLAIAKEEQVSMGDVFSPQWVDHSCERMADTQQKIIDLLGMDSDTFRSCVLIMQDQYGRFMEAKPEDRMSVLASLLGLGIYEQLEEETKKILQECNRELRNLKETTLQLEEEVGHKEGILAQLADQNASLNAAKVRLTINKNNLESLNKQFIDASRIETDIQNLKSRIESLSGQYTEKNEKLQKLLQNQAQTLTFLECEEILNRNHSELEEARHAYAALEGKDALRKEKVSQLEKVNKEISTLSNDKLRYEISLQDIEKKTEKLGSLETIINELAGVDEALKGQEFKKAEYTTYDVRIKSLQNTIAILDQKINACEGQAAILNNSNCIDISRAQCGFLKAAKDAQEKLPELKQEKEKYCQDLMKAETEQKALQYDPQVHETVKADFERFSKAQAEILTIKGDLKLIDIQRKMISDINEKIATLNTNASTLQEEITLLDQELAGFMDLISKIRQLEQSENDWKQIPQAKAYLDSIGPQIEDLNQELERISVEMKDLQNQIIALDSSKADITKLQEEINQTRAKVEECESEISNCNRQLGMLEEKLSSVRMKEEQLESIRSNIQSTSSRASYLQILVEAFSQDGIPHQIIRDIIPELEEAANDILGQMTGGRMRIEFRTERTLKSNKGKEVATLDIVIIDVDNGELPYLARSGGQKVRAALAVSFALAILKASRVGLQLGMMFVDEPPFLDDEGVEAYCMALESIHARYPEMRIIAISHDQNMKSQFPQQLYVELTENGSKIRRG